MHALTEFLFPAPARRTTGAIIGWWENRRLAYNLAVGGAGLVSLAAFSVFEIVVGNGVELPLFIAAAVFGVMANVCYCLGPTLELLIEKIWGRKVLPVGPSLYRIGLTFSVGLALFPTLIATILAAARVVAAVILGI